MMNRRFRLALWVSSMAAVFHVGCQRDLPGPPANGVDRTEAPDVSPTDDKPKINKQATALDPLPPEALTSPSPLANDECCTNPGEIANCWWADADADGVTCTPERPCASGMSCDYATTGPDGQGLCRCSSQGDCDDGSQMDGECVLKTGVCGPSFCNGYKTCSCWGGCIDEHFGGYENPVERCADSDAGFPGYCCEGKYPADPAGAAAGYCSAQIGCMGCVSDADCNDGRYCNGVETCNSGSCVAGTPPCAGGDPCNGACNEEEDNCLAPSGTSCDDGLYCNGKDACDGDGRCAHSGDPCTDPDPSLDHVTCYSCNELLDTCYQPADTTSCDDGDGCTLNDRCNGAGRCVPGEPVACGSAQCMSATCQNCDPSSPGCTPEGSSGWHCEITYAPGGATCNDLNGCTRDDICDGAGLCLGLPITAAECLGEIEDSVPGVKECNTAHCVSTGSDDHACFPVALAAPGYGVCNGDDDACTLDHCEDSADPLIGALCTPGPLRSCTSLSRPPCLTFTCKDPDTADDDFITSFCEHTFAATSVPCNADDNGCTEGDHCGDPKVAAEQGRCLPGDAASCPASDVCHETKCVSTSTDTHTCKETEKPYCCVDDADCGFLACDGPCVAAKCDPTTNTCSCDLLSGQACELEEGIFPPNCYAGTCDASGTCQPEVVIASQVNNLCSDLFETDRTSLYETAESFLGEFANIDEDGKILTTTGSTLCAQDNYYAMGDDCVEDDGDFNISNNPRLGQGGKDLVYAFRYQENGNNQFQLSSYIIKVESDYNLGLYIKTDIEDAASCPEGDSPGSDLAASLPVESNRCHFAFDDGVEPNPPIDVVEATCFDRATQVYLQECCDPCSEGGDCGYKWCRRGYNYDGSTCDRCVSGDCDAEWSYPSEPYNCNFMVPMQPDYAGYDYMAETVVFPKGSASGKWRTVFVFIDGVDATEGNFYLTVQKRRWWASPCDRIGDDPRVFDITHPGAEGTVFNGSLANVVNSMHDGGGWGSSGTGWGGTPNCGGYDCYGGWSGKSACHASGAANEFWPNLEHFKIHRQHGEGSSTYCLMTDETISDASDIVISTHRRTDSSALTICDESYEAYPSSENCAHDNLDNNAQMEFTAHEGELYLIQVSSFSSLGRPCSPDAPSNDDCNYRLTVYEGPCPPTCVSPLGDVAGTVSLNAGSKSLAGSTLSTSDNYSAGADHDEAWILHNDTSSKKLVELTYCTPSFDGVLALYDCERTHLTTRDSQGKGRCETITRTVLPDERLHVVADGAYGFWTTNRGPYTLGVVVTQL